MSACTACSSKPLQGRLRAICSSSKISLRALCRITTMSGPMKEYKWRRPLRFTSLQRVYKRIARIAIPVSWSHGGDNGVWSYLLGSSKNQRQYCARRSESRNQTGWRPNLASQLYGIRSGLLRHGQLPYRTWTQSIWAQVVNDVIGTNCK